MNTNRERTNDAWRPTDRAYVVTTGGSTTTSVTHPNSVGSIAIIKDNNNKNFAAIRDSGGVCLSDCSITRIKRSMSPGAQTRKDGNVWFGTLSGDLIGMCNGQLAQPANMPTINTSPTTSSVLLVQAYARMNQSKLITGESLADLNETIAMLRSPFKSARSLLSRMSKRRAWLLNKRKSYTFAKATADTWLEYRYGWKPLMMDMDTIIDIVHEKRDACQRRRLVARAGSKVSTSYTASRPAVHDSPSYRSYEGSVTESKEIRANAGVIYEVVNRTSSDEVAANLGTRPRDSAATLWEIIPYSFVIDWFVNVGEWLQAVTPDPTIHVLGNWVTSVMNSTYSRTYNSPLKPGFTPPELWWTGSYGSENITTFIMNRVCNQPLAYTPELTNLSLSILHQADAMALLIRPILGELRSFRH